MTTDTQEKLKLPIKEMMDAGLHFGHQTRRWNPKMKRYLYGSKNGIHIFDLEITSLYIERALEFIKHSVANGQKVLFASTKPQAASIITESAKKCGMPYVINKWMPGLLTNFSTIKRRIKYYNKLLDEEKAGDFEKYTKKEASKLRKELVKLEDAFGGVRELEKLPDIVFVADVVRDRIIVDEAVKKRLKVVAITDSNANPDGVEYVIPCNDDAVLSIQYVVGKITDAVNESKGKSNKK